MRNHPLNSGEAAARIVALTLIADGHVSAAEVRTVEACGLERELGLRPGGFSAEVQAVCEDLLLHAYGAGASVCRIDAATLESMLDEVDDPVLQDKVLRLMRAVAQADGHLAEAEAQVVEAAQARWGRDLSGVRRGPTLLQQSIDERVVQPAA